MGVILRAEDHKGDVSGVGSGSRLNITHMNSTHMHPYHTFGLHTCPFAYIRMTFIMMAHSLMVPVQPNQTAGSCVLLTGSLEEAKGSFSQIW